MMTATKGPYDKKASFYLASTYDTHYDAVHIIFIGKN